MVTSNTSLLGNVADRLRYRIRASITRPMGTVTQNSAVKETSGTPDTPKWSKNPKLTSY